MDEKVTAAETVDLPPELLKLCVQTGTRPEGIKALMSYYKNKCDWTEKRAVAQIKGLFTDGTIDELKKL